MADEQFQLLEIMLRELGHDLRIIREITDEDVKFGRDHVDNGMCYPTIITAGVLIRAAINFKDAQGNPSNDVAILMTQTGGSCRASNYVYVLRDILERIGRPDIAVIPLAFSPTGKEPWNPLGFKLRDLKHAMFAFLLGDVLMTLLNKTRPYEVVPSTSQNIVDGIIALVRAQGFKTMTDRKFRALLKDTLARFELVQVSGEPKPTIGIVGEIFLKYNAYANGHLIANIEQAGCEAVVTPLTDFFLYCFTGPIFRRELLRGSFFVSALMKFLIYRVEKRKTAINRLMSQYQCSRGLHWAHILDLSKKVDDSAHPEQQIISRANKAGEGWLLSAEVVDLIEQGCAGVIVAQPFGCLPNHVIARGTANSIRERFPHAHILVLEYDPNTSAANRKNRFTLMIQSALGRTAFKR